MSDKVWSTDAFRAHLTDKLRGICKDNGTNFDNDLQRGIAFQQWSSELIAQHEGIDNEEDRAVFSTNDLKIDAVLEDTDQKALYLVQTKYIAPNRNAPMDEGEVNDFFSRHSLLLDGKWVAKHASEELLEYVGDYAARLEENWTIHWYFISTGIASERIKSLVLDQEASIKSDQPGVSFYIYDQRDLKEYFIELQTLEQRISEKVEFDIQIDKWILLKRPRRTLIAVMKANALVALYKKERERIFAYNIRSFLGRKGINKDIISTASTEPEDFFYFNNGVSAICTHFELNEDTGHFVGSNFQIINGAQTVGSLKNVRSLRTEVEVLVRITQGESVKTEKASAA